MPHQRTNPPVGGLSVGSTPKRLSGRGCVSVSPCTKRASRASNRGSSTIACNRSGCFGWALHGPRCVAWYATWASKVGYRAISLSR